MKVLVAIDSSVYADQVLQAVHKRLWPQHCEIHVITAVEPCATSESQDEFVTQSEAILGHRINELKRSLAHCRVTGEVIVGTAAHVITDTAGELNADLIILGSHGDTGPRKAQIGSVAAKVVEHAPCTVELVKVHRFASYEGRKDRRTEDATAVSKGV